MQCSAALGVTGQAEAPCIQLIRQRTAALSVEFTALHNTHQTLTEKCPKIVTIITNYQELSQTAPAGSPGPSLLPWSTSGWFLQLYCTSTCTYYFHTSSYTFGSPALPCPVLSLVHSKVISLIHCLIHSLALSLDLCNVQCPMSNVQCPMSMACVYQ